MSESSGKFSHIDAGGQANMVDVSDKSVTKREATAEGFLYVSDGVIQQISEAKIAKGDVFAAVSYTHLTLPTIYSV